MTKSFAIAAAVVGFAAMAQAQTAPAGQPAAPAPAPAPTAPMAGNVALPTKIAIIAIQQAIMATKEGSAAGAALNTKYQPKKDDFEKRQRDIQALSDQLKKGSATMSDDAKTKIERDIDSKTKALQRDTQDTSADYEEEMGKVYQEMGNKMLQIIEQYSYQNGYAVVLDVSNQQTPVIWAAPSANIIADIIKLYDQAHPGLPAAAKPAAPAKPVTPATTIKKQ
ncbi:MAG: OmpH family outer membrane protein [Bryobacteraceae bacterium]